MPGSPPSPVHGPMQWGIVGWTAVLAKSIHVDSSIVFSRSKLATARSHGGWPFWAFEATQ